MRLFSLETLTLLLALVNSSLQTDTANATVAETGGIDPYDPRNYCSHEDPDDPHKVGCCAGRLESFCFAVSGGQVSDMRVSLSNNHFVYLDLKDGNNNKYCGNIADIADKSDVYVTDNTKLNIQVMAHNKKPGGNGLVLVAQFSNKLGCDIANPPWYRAEKFDSTLQWAANNMNYQIELVSGTSTQGKLGEEQSM